MRKMLAWLMSCCLLMTLWLPGLAEDLVTKDKGMPVPFRSPKEVSDSIMQSYENKVYCYAMQVPLSLYAVNEKTLAEIMAEYRQEESEDPVYDVRIWISENMASYLEVQCKKPTYDSLGTEIQNHKENAQAFIQSLQQAGCSNVESFGGEAWVLSGGMMLESGFSYTLPDGTKEVQVVFDLYTDIAEYCLKLCDQNRSEAEARAFLRTIAQTFRVIF